MGGADGKVVIDTSLNNKGFIRGVNGLKNNMNGLTSCVRKLGVTIAAVLSVKKLVEFGKECVDLGSNIAEVQNVVDVAFGDMAYKVEEFAKTSIKSYGMSKLAAKKTASTYMAMAKGMGMNEEAASDMAISLAGLSGDVASFFNISQELADVKLKGVFTGETEALKDLGVVMTQANLKAFALKKGLDGNLESMSQAELVALRYEFVMDQLALAHGDFARTADSWANQTRVLSEQWKELKSILGQTLITVLRPLVVTVNEIVSGMIDTANTINAVVTALFGGTSTQMQQTQQDAAGVGTAIQGSVDDQNALTDAVEDTNKAVKKNLANFDDLNQLTKNTAAAVAAESEDNSSGVGSGITHTVGEKAEGVSAKMQAMLDDLKDGFRELKDWVVGFFRPFRESWNEHGAKVMDSIKRSIESVILNIRAIGTAFMRVWSDGTGKEFLDSILRIVVNIHDRVSTLGARFREAWAANGNGEAIWRSILGVIQTVVSFVERLTAKTVEWTSQLDLVPITSAFRGLLEAINPVVEIITDGLFWAYENVLLPLAKWTIEEAAPAALDFLRSVIEALTPILEAMAPIATWFWEDFLQPLGAWTGEIIIRAIQGITDKLNAFASWARANPEHVKKIAEAIFALLGGIVAYYTVNKIANVITAIKNAFVAFSSGLNLANIQAGLSMGAFGALFMLIMQLAGCWDQLTGVEKVVAVLAAVTTAAFAAALAVGAFQSALSMGLAIAAIVAGIVTLTAVIAQAQSRANSMKSPQYSGMSSMGAGAGRYSALSTRDLPHLARGAVIPPNREFMAVLGDQKNGTNIEAPVSEIEAAVARGIDAAGVQRDNQSERPIYLQVDGKTFARLINPYLVKEGKRLGVKLVKGV